MRVSTIRLTPARRSRLADVLYGQLLEQIASSRMEEGRRLPSEAEIGTMFGASRPVVRQALMRLQADGLVYARKGAGTFVRVRPPERLTDFVEPGDVAGYLRSLEARAALESETARLAAMRRTKDQLAAVTKATGALEDALRDGRLGLEADLAFHMAVAEATGNELFPRLLGELGDLMRGSMRMALGLTRSGSELRRARVLAEHRQIADAIAAQDGEAAALYMRYHLTQTRLRTTDARSEA